MNYKVIPVDKFKKEAKRLIKKYPSLKSELTELAEFDSIDDKMLRRIIAVIPTE